MTYADYVANLARISPETDPLPETEFPRLLAIASQMIPQPQDEAEKNILDFFKDTPGPFRWFRNPMREDGVFLGQDLPIEPYPGHRDCYPAVPLKGKNYPVQVPLPVAERVLAVLNRGAGGPTA